MIEKEKREEAERKLSSLQVDKRNLESRNSNLQNRCDELEDKLNDLRDDCKWRDEEIKKLKNQLQRQKEEHDSEKLKWTKTEGEMNTEKARTEERLGSKSNELIKVSKQLEDTKNELSLVRVEKDNWIAKLEDKLDEKNVIHNQKVGELNEQLTSLRVINERKDGDLQRKNEEIERLKKLAENRGERAEKSHEELLNEKLTSRKRNLELFATELRIDLEQIHSLTKYHERLLAAQKNHNQANIDIHEENISRVKQELTNQRISVIHIQEICRKCERIVELRWALEQQQQQYEARQEQPTNNI